MATIPVIPGVQVTTGGILNKSLKDIICALLFGGLNNMLKGPLLCVTVDIDKLIGEYTDLPTLADLKSELMNLKGDLKAFEDSIGIKDMLGRVNGAIAEVQSLLALDGLCAIPLKAPLIPNVLDQVIDAEFAQANAILSDLGRLAKPSLCLSGNGGFSTGSYNPSSILGSIQGHLNAMGNIPDSVLKNLVTRLRGVRTALNKSINRQLFPDFRHKYDLTTGRAFVSASGSRAIVLASAVEQQSLLTAIAASSSDPAKLAAWQQIAGMPSSATADQIIALYPNGKTPNLKDATTMAQTLVASVDKTASYPANVNGITHPNIWPSMLGPDVYAMTVNALTPQDPLFTQQDPIYDYCGKFVGYSSTVISGDIAYAGGDPTVSADLNPPQTNFNFVWITERNCWGVVGIQSDQIVQGRAGTYLDANPTVEMYRGYSNILGIPSLDLLGKELAAEFFICYVGTDLKPTISSGNIVPFNLGLSRLETYELLEDANGHFDKLNADLRKSENPTGTNLYFAIGKPTYSGTTAPLVPDATVWWYNTANFKTYKWLNPSWIEVQQSEIDAAWFGSSTTPTSPSVNYLAYSNKDGSVFGLIKLV